MLFQVTANWPKVEPPFVIKLAVAAPSAALSASKAKAPGGRAELENGSRSGSSPTTTQRSGLEGSETSSTASPEDVARTWGDEKKGRIFEVTLRPIVTGLVLGLLTISR